MNELTVIGETRVDEPVLLSPLVFGNCWLLPTLGESM